MNYDGIESEKRRRSLSLTEVVTIAIICLILVAILRPVFATTKDYLRPWCLSNLKQLAVATELYREVESDFLPGQDWIDAVFPYVKNPDLFKCPQPRGEQKPYGYAMNYVLVHRQALSFPLDRTVLYFESDARARNVVSNLAGRATSRHGRTSIVAYLDTHARAIREDKSP